MNISMQPVIGRCTGIGVQQKRQNAVSFGSSASSGDDFFCKVARGDIPGKTLVASNQRSIAVLDGYPVGRGHTLIVPKRHVASVFDLTQAELKDMLANLKRSKERLEEAFRKGGLPQPDGYNIGLNEGRAAGRTVDHCHIHLIPRYNGDMEDPTGGVRGVIPSQQKYSGPPDASVDNIFAT